jgi:hypothetical protein
LDRVHTRSNETIQRGLILRSSAGLWKYWTKFIFGVWDEKDDSALNRRAQIKCLSIYAHRTLRTNGYHSCFVFRGSWVHTFVRKPALLSEDFLVFLFLHVNSGSEK